MAEKLGEFLQLRKALGKTLALFAVDGELEVRGGFRRRDLMAVDGGENLAERLRLVGVKAQPEGTGCLYL